MLIFNFKIVVLVFIFLVELLEDVLVLKSIIFEDFLDEDFSFWWIFNGIKGDKLVFCYDIYVFVREEF